MSSIDNLNLTLLNAGKVDLDSKWNYDNVISPFSRLYLITRGVARVYHSGKTFHLIPNHIYLIPSYTYSRYQCDDHFTQYYLSILEEPGEGESIYDTCQFIYERTASERDQDLFDRILELNPRRSLINDDPESYDNVPSTLNFKTKNSQLPTDAYLETKGIMSILFSRFISREKKQEGEKYLRNSRINESLKYIRTNLHKELTVSMLAEQAHLNADYYSRLFQEVWGIRPVKFIQMRRIERAQLLLTTTKYTLGDIAEKVGLGNLSYFSRLFKSQTGKTPGDYRKEQWSR
ncbi:MAG: helix-turn-helix transcriptional regulator [Cyclobacteriaceae bacterium]